MRYFKILGWLWLVFGLLLSIVTVWALIARAVDPYPVVTSMTATAWWEEFIVCSLECAFVVASAVSGLALLRRWRRAHIAIGLLAVFLLALYTLLVLSPSFPPVTIAQNMLDLSPLAVLAIYSIVVVLSVKYEPHVA
jgi:hypothetical protein